VTNAANNGSPSLPSIDVEFAKEAFGLDCIKKAAYRFVDVFALDIRTGPNGFLCQLRFHRSHSVDAARDVENKFRIEVLDQDLRARISEETATTRNVILGYAFSRTGLQDE